MCRFLFRVVLYQACNYCVYKHRSTNQLLFFSLSQNINLNGQVELILWVWCVVCVRHSFINELYFVYVYIHLNNEYILSFWFCFCFSLNDIGSLCVVCRRSFASSFSCMRFEFFCYCCCYTCFRTIHTNDTCVTAQREYRNNIVFKS